MKLVVITWTTDGYTYTWDIVRPVEYESAEALLVHLEENAKAKMAEVEAYRVARDAWTKAVAATKERPFPPCPPSVDRKFQLAMFTWALDEFGNYGVSGKWEWNFDVEILTIDEWFEKHGKEQE